MRDPNRIYNHCNKLAEIWSKVPDWRFGQLMINALSQYMSDHKSDCFYVEDENLFKYLENYINEITN